MVRKEPKRYVGSWLGGFELVDICWSVCLCIGQDGQLMLEEGQGLCMWRTVSVGCWAGI